MNTEVSQRTRRLAGVAGLFGALLFFAGDMLFYGHLGSGAGFHDGMIATVRNAPLARLFAGGLVGPVAACLCTVGFWHVYLNVRRTAGYKQLLESCLQHRCRTRLRRRVTANRASPARKNLVPQMDCAR
jgi:hypothetical protein